VKHAAQGSALLADGLAGGKYAPLIEHLELKAVQVKRVVHRNDIFYLPDFRRAELRYDVGPVHVHGYQAFGWSGSTQPNAHHK